MNDVTQRLEAVQRMMLVPSSAALADNVRRFWDTQDRLLDNMEKFANGWFKRRHMGSHAAHEAAQRMCTARTPEDAAPSPAAPSLKAGILAKVSVSPSSVATTLCARRSIGPCFGFGKKAALRTFGCGISLSARSDPQI